MTTGAAAGGSNSEAGGAAAAGAGSVAAGKTEETGKGAGAAGAAAGAGGAEGKGEGAGAGGKKDGEQAGGAAAAGGEKKGEEGKGGAATPKAPEKYDLKLGDNSRLSKSDLPRFEKIARANDWSQEDAQAALLEAEQNLQEQSDAWAEETRADKELGGDKLEATQQLTKAGIDFLFPKGDPHREGFLEFLNRGGAGNNIHVVRALARIGKAQSEDGNISGSGGTGDGPRAPEDVLYKSTPSSS